jgi:hypothetical protein
LGIDCDVMIEEKDWGGRTTYIPYSILIFRALLSPLMLCLPFCLGYREVDSKDRTELKTDVTERPYKRYMTEVEVYTRI